MLSQREAPLAYAIGRTDDLIELAIVSDDVKKAKKLLELKMVSIGVRSSST